MKKWLCLVLAGILLLCCVACDRLPVSPLDSSDIMSTTTPSSNATDGNTYLETDAEQSVMYNKAITTYNAFLRGEIAAKTDDGETVTVLQYGLTNEGIYSYALGDVNKDNVPELFIHGHHFHILALDETQLTEWYDSQSDQRIYLLENGAVWRIHSSVGYFYRYVTFDANGIAEDISFSQPYEDDPTSTYYFCGNRLSGEVSKEDWNDLTKPYFEQAEKTVELNWREWK